MAIIRLRLFVHKVPDLRLLLPIRAKFSVGQKCNIWTSEMFFYNNKRLFLLNSCMWHGCLFWTVNVPHILILNFQVNTQWEILFRSFPPATSNTITARQTTPLRRSLQHSTKSLKSIQNFQGKIENETRFGRNKWDRQVISNMSSL